jgi:hypothetical protein
MTPPAAGNKHIVTDEEIAEIETLGFVITSGKTPLTNYCRNIFRDSN